jgi:hypothetical protein
MFNQNRTGKLIRASLTQLKRKWKLALIKILNAAIYKKNICILIHVLAGGPEGRHHLGEPGLDGRIILKWIFKTWDGSMDWIELAQDRDRWWAFVNAVMNLRVP